LNNIYLIVGESGSGKTTIVTLLEKLHDLTSIQSYTTRPKRSENEIGHTFVTDEEFDKLTDMVAFTNYNGYRYCATAEQAENNSLYVIDIEGIKFFKNAYHGSKGVKVIYISSEIHTRVKRMEERGDTFDKIMERIVNDVVDFKEAKSMADYTVINGDNTQLVDVERKVWDFIRKCEEED